METLLRNRNLNDFEQKRDAMKNIITTGIVAGICAITATHSLAQTDIDGVRYYDFTHIIPMFEPTKGDITKPNLVTK